MSDINEEFPLDRFLSDDRHAGRLFFEKFGGLIRKAILKVRIKSDAVKHDDVFNGAIAHILDQDKKVLRMYKGRSKLSTYIGQVCYKYALTVAIKENKLTGRFDKTPIDELDVTGQEKWLLCSSDEIPINEIIAEIFGEISVDDKMKEALKKALEMVSEKDRVFTNMLYVQKRSTEEIRLFFDLNSPNSVYSWKNKLHAKLKKLIKKIMQGDL